MAFTTVSTQILILFALLGIGYFSSKGKLVSDTTVKQMTNVLVYIVVPCLIVSSFQVDYENDKLIWLAIAFASAVIIHIFSIIVSIPVFKRKSLSGDESRLSRFAVIYTNCGFIGFPLIEALLGKEYLIYGSAYLAVFFGFLWTHGVILANGGKTKISFAKTVINPNIIAIVVGLALFFLKIRLPDIFSSPLSYMGSMNTPLSLFLIGAKMASANMRSTLKDKRVYLPMILRNFLIPLIMVFAIKLLSIDKYLTVACLIPAICPVGGNLVIFSEMFDKDTALATRIFSASTLFCIISIPLILLLV